MTEPEVMLDALLAALPALGREELVAVLGVAIDAGYMDLDEHAPSCRDTAKRFACSGKTYHVPPCGDFTIVGDCEGDEDTFCRVNGLDCPDCAAYDKLLGILARARASS